MQPYGWTKRTHKIHPHNECSICAENSWNKKKARQKNRAVTEKELVDADKTSHGNAKRSRYAQRQDDRARCTCNDKYFLIHGCEVDW